jgi:hypothetical protein
MTIKELQEAPIRIMKWFYSPLSFWRIGLRTIAFPFDYLIRGWKNWQRGWWRDIINYGGHLLLREWDRKEQEKKYLKMLEEYIEQKKLSL